MMYQIKTWAPKTLPCPTCGKDVSLTQTGKFWQHDVPADMGYGICEVSGSRPEEVPFSGRLLVRAAKQVAFAVHEKDRDKVGDEYHLHLTQTAMGVRVLAGDEWEALAAAYLHDAIEDHPLAVSGDKLRSWGFPEGVVKTVLAVSKKQGMAQEDFLAQVIAAGRDAMLVNLADTLSNTRPDRMKRVEAKLGKAVVTRLLKKYRPRIARLMLELEIIADEDTQSKLSTTPVGTASYSSGGSSVASAGEPQWFLTSSLYPGDWLAGAKAPLANSSPHYMPATSADGTKGRDLNLADGSTFFAEDDAHWMLWTTAGVAEARRKRGKDWSPAQEEQTSEALYKAARDAKKKAASADESAGTAKDAPESICGKCGKATYSSPQGTSVRWQHVVKWKAGEPWHAVTRPTSERLNKLWQEGKIDADAVVEHAIDNLEDEYSLCGECGADTVLREGHVTWSHVDVPKPYHPVVTPTVERIDRLIERGLATPSDLDLARSEEPDGT